MGRDNLSPHFLVSFPRVLTGIGCVDRFTVWFASAQGPGRRGARLGPLTEQFAFGIQ
jgi:hypothetical protein